MAEFELTLLMVFEGIPMGQLHGAVAWGSRMGQLHAAPVFIVTIGMHVGVNLRFRVSVCVLLLGSERDPYFGEDPRDVQP